MSTTRTRPRTIAAAIAATALLTIAGCSDAQEDPAGRASPTPTTSDVTTGAIPAPTTTGPEPEVSTFTEAPAPRGQEGVPRGLVDLGVDVEAVDGSDVDAVAYAFTAAVLTPDAAIDLSPADASRRASVLATEDYGQALAADRVARGGADWLALSEQEGYQSLLIEDTNAGAAGAFTPPAPAEVEAVRPYIVTTQPVDAPGLTPDTFSVVVFLSRTDADAPWRVFAFEQEVPRR